MGNYYFKENNLSACCNLIIWDTLMVGLVAGSVAAYQFPNLQAIQCILIGVVAGIVMIILWNIKVIGFLITLASSALWAYLGYSLVGQFTNMEDISVGWKIGISAFCFVIAWAIHEMSREDLGMKEDGTKTFDFDRTKKRGFGKRKEFPEDVYQDMAVEELNGVLQKFTEEGQTYIELRNKLIEISGMTKAIADFDSQVAEMSVRMDSYIEQMNAGCTADTLRYLLTKMLELVEQFEAINTEMTVFVQEGIDAQMECSSYESVYFTGCDDLDSLNKRYKDLCRVYHPDSENGSTNAFQRMSEEYHNIKKSFAKEKSMQ